MLAGCLRKSCRSADVLTSRHAAQGQTEVTPVLVKASVERGMLHAFGRDIPLPIRGSGYVNVAYLGEALRVLQNRTGAVTVQVREDRLQQLQ